VIHTQEGWMCLAVHAVGHKIQQYCWYIRWVQLLLRM